ncbi:MAG: hypothetical protein Fur0020_15520 [Thermodesulfovibrionia bacterium]
MPSLERLYQDFKDKPFVIIGIDIEEERERVLSLVNDYRLTYPNLLDSHGEVSNLYSVKSTPTKILIDKGGNIIGVSLGYREWDTDEMKRLIGMLVES